MKTILVKLNLDYVVSDEDRKAINHFANSDRSITEWMVKRAIESKLKEGVDHRGDNGTLQGRYNRIWKKITLATKANKDEVELTIDELRFCNESLREWKCPPQWLGWGPDTIAYFDKLVRDYEAAEKADAETKKTAEAPK